MLSEELQRQSSSLCPQPPTAGHTGPREENGNAEAQSDTKAPFHPPFSLCFYKSVALSVSSALNRRESRTGYTIQEEEGMKGGQSGKCLHQFLIFLVSSNKAVTFEEISVELFKPEVCRCSDSPQPTGLAAHLSVHLLSVAETQRLESTQADELFSNPHKGSL